MDIGCIAFICSVLWVSTNGATAGGPKPPITQDCYTAAVYEHVKYAGTLEEDPLNVMRINLEAYENATARAKSEGADIIVFPEYGLFGVTNDKRSLIRPYLENIPSGEERKNPCDEPHPYSNNSFLVTLSCMAKRYAIYLVANVGDMKPCDKQKDPDCPDDKAYQYNTNVAFDRQGTLVSRYHKKHLFFEYKFNVPKEFEYVYFDTEFGRFGSFVCFDIVFQPAVKLVEDHDIDTIVFTTWWFDAPPALLAPQNQQAYAIRNKVNTLAANIHDPKVASMGSGIYAGVNGAVAYVYEPDEYPKLVVASIPSKSGEGRICKDRNVSKVINFGEDDGEKVLTKDFSALASSISDCGLVKLNRAEDEIVACHNGLCCRLQYKISNASGFEDGEKFYFAVCNSSETDNHGHYHWAVEKCFVAKMDPKEKPDSEFATNTSTVFERLHLEGEFSTSYVYPGIMGQRRQLVDKKYWNYSVEESGQSFISIPDGQVTEPILIVSLYGRAYDRDPVYRQ